MKLGAHVEVHHGGARAQVVFFHQVLARLHRFIHHRCYLKQLFHCVPRCFVQFLRVQDYSGFARKKLANLSNEVNAILFVLDVIADVHFRIVPLREPVKDIGYELEVGVPEILHGYITVVAEGPHNFAEASEISVRHFEFNLVLNNY